MHRNLDLASSGSAAGFPAALGSLEAGKTKRVGSGPLRRPTRHRIGQPGAGAALQGHQRFLITLGSDCMVGGAAVAQSVALTCAYRPPFQA